jgi:hypothetical protein
VLRGGSWNNNQNNARCTNRNRNNPNNRNDNNGFRVVVSHIVPHSTGNAGWLRLDGRGMKDGATEPLAESRIFGCGPGEYRIGPAPGRCSLGRATYQCKRFDLEVSKWRNRMIRPLKLN